MMKEVIVLKANKKHKEFIIHTNNIINNVNDTEQTNGLEENIDKDYFLKYYDAYEINLKFYYKKV